MKNTEEASEKKDHRIEELQRLLGGMEQESSTLREAIRSREEELRELRKIREEGPKGEHRSVNTHTHTRTNRQKYPIANNDNPATSGSYNCMYF